MAQQPQYATTLMEVIPTTSMLTTMNSKEKTPREMRSLELRLPFSFRLALTDTFKSFLSVRIFSRPHSPAHSMSTI